MASTHNVTDSSDELAALRTKREAVVADLATATAARSEPLINELQAALCELDVRIAAVENKPI